MDHFNHFRYVRQPEGQRFMDDQNCVQFFHVFSIRVGPTPV